jgi:hypothetical protein
MKDSTKLAGVIFALLLLILVIYFGMMFYRRSVLAESNATATPTPQMATSSPGENITFEPQTQSDTLAIGGSSYRDPKGVFVFLYPNEYSLDSQNNGQYTRIFKRGEMQRPQSEMSDGVMMVFESIDLGNQTLGEWIDATIKTATADGTSQVTSPKQTIVVNDYAGFTYTLRGLGESKYVVLQGDPNSSSAVSVVALVADPQQKGYQAEVDAIMSTLQILK